jgi:hypothetical protein
MYGWRGEVHAGFWWLNLRERDHLEDRSLDERIILRWIQEVGWRGMNWIDLAQNRVRWLALVNAIMRPRVP